MTEFFPQTIFKNESFITESKSNLGEQDAIYSNAVHRKCGEIILLANNKFWFLCTFCDERFHSIVVFRNHIKGVHITDSENVWKSKNESPLNLHPNEKLVMTLVAEANGNSNCNNQVDIEEKIWKKTNEEYKFNSGAEIGGFKNEIQDHIINRSDSNGIEAEIISTEEKTCKIQEGTRAYISENENDSNTNSRSNETLICNDILSASKNVHKKRNRKKKVYSCSYCQHIARDKLTLEAHMQSNHDTITRYQCEECGKCFGNRSNLRSHLVIHSGTRPYKCDFCNAGFSHSNSLKAHRYLHTGNRPYKCIQCDKGFVSSGALKIHMREHTGETPFVCQFCEKAFATQCSYKRHMISHSGHRAYECKECEKAFIHKETLTKHMACHSTEKKFVCDTCQKKFNHKKNLSQHKKLHLNIKQYICKVCNKDFAQNAGLYSHMKYHKNKE